MTRFPAGHLSNASRTANITVKLGLVMLLGGSIAFAQDPDPVETIRIDSSLVNVPVIVSDRNGRYIAGLKQESFRLFDNRSPREIVVFEATEEPLNIALLLDTSRSTERVLDEIRDAAKNFVKQLRAQDRAMVVAFDYQVRQLIGLTSDRKQIERAIKNAKVGDLFGTVLYDAVASIIDGEFRSRSGRKAIILLTDGQDYGSLLFEPELIDKVIEADTMIYTVYYQTGPIAPRRMNRPPIFGDPGVFGGRQRPPNPGRQQPNGNRQRRPGLRAQGAVAFLQELADSTAGRFYESEVSDLKKTFGLIAEELRFQYRLGFYPPSEQMDGTIHTLQVRVDRADTVVRARRNYPARLRSSQR